MNPRMFPCFALAGGGWCVRSKTWESPTQGSTRTFIRSLPAPHLGRRRHSGYTPATPPHGCLRNVRTRESTASAWSRLVAEPIHESSTSRTSTSSKAGSIQADTVWVASGGRLDSTAIALSTGGVFGGIGATEADLTNDGTLSPGDSLGVAGVFTVGGDYVQTGSGLLEVELGGTAPDTEYDRLAVAGEALLAGVLRLRLLDVFLPKEGDVFELLTATSITGEFESVDAPQGLEATLSYNATSVTATITSSTASTETIPGPEGLRLSEPFPNPSHSSTTVAFSLEEPGRVRLIVYDLLGRQVEVLVEGIRSPGEHVVQWEAREMPAGTYLLRLEAGRGARTRLVTLLK